MTDAFATVDGARIRYWDSGGPGPAVLLTHGIGESLEFWHLQFEQIGSQRRLLAWDMPGHGLSDEMPGAMTLGGQATVAWKLLDSLGVRSAHLVGNSLGAAMSIRMAAQQPDRVKSLLLANSAALGKEVFVPFRIMTLPFLGELMNKPGPATVKLQIKSIVARPESVTPTVRSAIERNVNRPGATPHFLRLLRWMTTLSGQRSQVVDESIDILRSVAAPVLFVHGSQDGVLPASQSAHAHSLLPTSALQILADCGHTPQLEQPDAFNALLLQHAAAA